MGCASSRPAESADAPRTLQDVDAKISSPLPITPVAQLGSPATSPRATPDGSQVPTSDATDSGAPSTPAAAATPAPQLPPTPPADPAPAPAPEEAAVDWANADWRARLSAEEYKVLREQHTEPAGSGEYDRFYPPEGHFVCRGCKNALFSAAAKFKSGCGWPSFDRCYEASVELRADTSHGVARRELVCARCQGHLGHLFDGEKLTPVDQRHCVNSLSIKFVKGPPPDGTIERSAGLDLAAVDRELAKVMPEKGGSSGAASVVPKSDLDLSDAGLAADWQATRDKDRGWCLCSYAPESKVRLVPVAKGDCGFDELRAALKDRPDAVSYGVVAATVDGRLRFVFLCYIGEATSAIKRGRAAMHSPHVEKFFDGTVGAFPALTSADELETAHVNRLLKEMCKGAKEAVVR